MSSDPDVSESTPDEPTEESEQSEEQTDKATDDQPADDEKPAEESEDKPAEQSEDTPAEQSEDTAAEGQSDQPADDQPADDGGSSGALNEKRQNMLDLVNKWMPTSLSNPRVDGTSVKPGQDLMAKAGWDKARGQQSVVDKAAGKKVVTSCGDILAALLKLWKSNFVGYFNIRDAAVGGPGAKARGFYVERDQLVMEDDVVKSPKPGDIIVLRNGVGKSATGVGHVGILVEAGKDTWRTADGGGGALPDQTAEVTERTVTWTDGVPIMKSPTDLQPKELDGWIDLDKLEQTGS